MKKILFIHHASGWGGAPKAMINLINSLDKKKYSIKVLIFKDSIISHKLEENKIEYCIATSDFYKKYYSIFVHSEVGYYKWYQIYHILKFSIIWLLSRFYFAKKELSLHEYDFVHLNSSMLTDWLAPARKKGKVLIHIREPFRKGRFDLLNFIFTYQIKKYANQIIAISNDNAKRINLYYKTVVVYDHSEIPSILPSESSFQSRKVLYLGGSEHIKGFSLLVNALEYIEKDIHVYFAGNYSNRIKNHTFKSSLKNILYRDNTTDILINKMRASSQAVEIGLVYDVASLLHEVACLISPFAKPHFSLPVIEAFYCNKPVIVTDVAGSDEVVTNRINGLIVSHNDPRELAKAINFICNEPEEAKRMGVNGFKDAQIKFSIANMSKIAQIYDNL